MLIRNGFANQYANICIKPTAVPNPFAVVNEIVRADPLRNNGAYRFEDQVGNFIQINIYSDEMKVDLLRQKEDNRLAYLMKVPKYQHYLFILDTLTTMDVSYLATLKLESIIYVRVKQFPSKEVQNQLNAVNSNRRWHEIILKPIEKSTNGQNRN